MSEQQDNTSQKNVSENLTNTQSPNQDVLQQQFHAYTAQQQLLAKQYASGFGTLPQQPTPNNAVQLELLKKFWKEQLEEVKQTPTDSAFFRNHQLPLARIKKIMKSDEDVRMISAEAPILFAKACEMFILELTLRSWMQAEEGKRRTLQRGEVAAAIASTDIFDFLEDVLTTDGGCSDSGPGSQAGAGYSRQAGVDPSSPTAAQSPPPHVLMGNGGGEAAGTGAGTPPAAPGQMPLLPPTFGMPPLPLPFPPLLGMRGCPDQAGVPSFVCPPLDPSMLPFFPEYMVHAAHMWPGNGQVPPPPRPVKSGSSEGPSSLGGDGKGL